MSSLENMLKVTDLILFYASMNPPLIMRVERLGNVPKVNSLFLKNFYLHLLYSEFTPGPQVFVSSVSFGVSFTSG